MNDKLIQETLDLVQREFEGALDANDGTDDLEKILYNLKALQRQQHYDKKQPARGPTIQVKCPDCLGIQICKATSSHPGDGRCIFTAEVEEPECDLCGRLLACSTCGDRGFVETSDALAVLRKRVEFLAAHEEEQRDSYLQPFGKITTLRDLSTLAEFSTKAHVHNMKAAAYRWILHDVETFLGLKPLNLLEHNAP